ncbi:hypothetical protein FSP39_024953, partial [Pinctada imbricata]
DAHSDFVSSSRKLIEATKSKLMIMNGISNELRYLAGQIKDDRQEKKDQHSTEETKNSRKETNNTGTKMDLKSEKKHSQQNIKIVVPVCTNDVPEKDVRKTSPKPTVRSRYYRRTPRKKVGRDSSLAELAKRFCKKNKKSSKLRDPLKYLEDVQSSRKSNEESDKEKKSKPDGSDSERSDGNTRQSTDDATDDAASSNDDKTPRESLLPVIKITRKSDRTELTNIDAKKYSNREKRAHAKCHECIAQAWCEKQNNKPPKQNGETHLRNGSFNKTYLKLCQRQICTRHSVPECNISTIQFETKTEIRQTTGLLSPLSRRIHTTAVPVRSGIITGKLRHLTSGFFSSEIIKSKEQIPMALTPEKYACPKLLSFGSERINAEYLTHRRILRPSKVTLQSSDSPEVGFLPLDEISVGFRFKLGRKQTFPVNQWSGRLHYGQIDEMTLQKSKTHYDGFRT